jgi:hypothetical protein
MTVDVLNNTTNAKIIPTIIANNALGAFASYMNLAKTVSRDFDFTPATQGASIKIPRRGALEAKAKTAGNEVTPQNPTMDDVTVTLNQHYEVTLIIDDVTKVLQNQDIQIGYGEDAGIALAEQVEGALAALYASIPNDQTGALTTSTSDTIISSFLAARQMLVEQKVPLMAPKFGYFHPSLYTKLLGIQRFTSAADLGGGNVITSGKLAPIAGIQPFESQMVVSTGSPATYHNMIYTKNALVLASRPLPLDGNGLGASQSIVQNSDIGMGLRTTMAYDAKLQAMQLTLDILFGVAFNDERCIVELTS